MPDAIETSSYGWQLNGDPVMSTQLPAPADALELLRCGCKTGCESIRCKCVRQGASCTELCLCENCDNAECCLADDLDEDSE